MNSLCKQYISEVKLLLPAIGKSEKNYLASLTSNLEDFCDDTSPQTIDDLYQEFGTPVDTVNSYISTLPTETLIKRIRKSKYLRYFIVTLILLFLPLQIIEVFKFLSRKPSILQIQILNKEKKISMKRKITLCLISPLFLLCSIPTSTKADTIFDTCHKTPYTIQTVITDASPSINLAPTLSRTSHNITKTKTTYMRDSSGTVL